MSEVVVVAIWGFLGTVVGSVGGILASSKLTAFRLKRLEKKVEKHNNLIERTFIIEGDMKVVKSDIKDIRSDIQELKGALR